MRIFVMRPPMPARWESMVRLATISTLAVVSSFGQGQSRPESVLVTITTHGMYLSIPRVRPGPVTFVIVNRTTAVNPEIEIGPPGIGVASLSRVQGLRTGRKVVHSVALGAGTYTIRLKDVPSNKADLTVAP